MIAVAFQACMERHRCQRNIRKPTQHPGPDPELHPEITNVHHGWDAVPSTIGRDFSKHLAAKRNEDDIWRCFAVGASSEGRGDFAMIEDPGKEILVRYGRPSSRISRNPGAMRCPFHLGSVAASSGDRYSMSTR